MEDTAAPQATDTDADTTVEPDTEQPEQPDRGDEAAKWKAMARKHEAQAKKNAEAAAKWAEYEQGQKTDSEKNAARIQELETQLAEAERGLLRSKVAAEKGLEPELAETLSGSTAEEMAEHADRLLAAIERRFAPKSKPAPEATGAGKTGEPEQLDPLSLAAKVRGLRQ